MDPRKLSTEELVRLCLATRDEVLWAEFVRRFQPLLAGVIVKCLYRCSRWIDRELADYLVGEVFFKLCKDDFKALRNFEFRHEIALHGFLKVMAGHVAEDHIRQKNSEKGGGRLKQVDMEKIQNTVAEPSNFSDLIHRRNQIQKIEDCLRQLANKPNFARDYKIFWLYNRDGVTAQEISQLPDIGFNTVKGVESALLRLNRWVLQCVQRGKAKQSSGGPGSMS